MCGNVWRGVGGGEKWDRGRRQLEGRERGQGTVGGGKKDDESKKREGDQEEGSLPTGLQRRKRDERPRGEGRGMERSLKALKHFALPAQQMPHSVWHSDLWAHSIYTLTVSLQGQHKTHGAATLHSPKWGRLAARAHCSLGAYTGTEKGKEEFFYFAVSSETSIAPVSRSDGSSGSMLFCYKGMEIKMQILLFINALLVLVGRTDHEKRERTNSGLIEQQGDWSLFRLPWLLGITATKYSSFPPGVG